MVEVRTFRFSSPSFPSVAHPFGALVCVFFFQVRGLVLFGGLWNHTSGCLSSSLRVSSPTLPTQRTHRDTHTALGDTVQLRSTLSPLTSTPLTSHLFSPASASVPQTHRSRPPRRTPRSGPRVMPRGEGGAIGHAWSPPATTGTRPSGAPPRLVDTPSRDTPAKPRPAPPWLRLRPANEAPDSTLAWVDSGVSPSPPRRRPLPSGLVRDTTVPRCPPPTPSPLVLVRWDNAPLAPAPADPTRGPLDAPAPLPRGTVAVAVGADADIPLAPDPNPSDRLLWPALDHRSLPPAAPGRSRALPPLLGTLPPSPLRSLPARLGDRSVVVAGTSASVMGMGRATR